MLKFRSLLLFAFLFILFTSCGENDIAITENTSVITTEAEVVTTETEIVTTEAVSTTAEPILFPYEPTVVPIVDAESYQKKAIDILGYDLDYTHSVVYPKIDMYTPGALALNEKIAKRYEEIIASLKNNTEGNHLYNIDYTVSCGGSVYFIKIFEHIGWQYSEGSSSQKIYYYDAEADKELTLDECIAKYNIDMELAERAVLWSYELEKAGMGGNEGTNAKTLFGEATYAPSPDEFYYYGYNEFNESVGLDGIEVLGDSVTLYYYGHAYVRGLFTCEINKTTYEPVYPNYRGYSLARPSAEAIVSSLTLYFENGVLIDYAYPKDLEFDHINYSSTYFSITTNERLDDCFLSVNGEQKQTWSSAGYDDNPDRYTYSFYLPSITNYIPLNEIKTFEITFTE